MNTETKDEMVLWHRQECNTAMEWQQIYIPILKWAMYIFTFGTLLFIGTRGILW